MFSTSFLTLVTRPPVAQEEESAPTARLHVGHRSSLLFASCRRAAYKCAACNRNAPLHMGCLYMKPSCSAGSLSAMMGELVPEQSVNTENGRTCAPRSSKNFAKHRRRRFTQEEAPSSPSSLQRPPTTLAFLGFGASSSLAKTCENEDSAVAAALDELFPNSSSHIVWQLVGSQATPRPLLDS